MKFVWGKGMVLPKFNISSLADLDTVTGLIATVVDVVRVQSSDDTIVILITFLYELNPIRGLF
jgi:hypothetical protein